MKRLTEYLTEQNNADTVPTRYYLKTVQGSDSPDYMPRRQLMELAAYGDALYEEYIEIFGTEVPTQIWSVGIRSSKFESDLQKLSELHGPMFAWLTCYVYNRLKGSAGEEALDAAKAMYKDKFKFRR